MIDLINSNCCEEVCITPKNYEGTTYIPSEQLPTYEAYLRIDKNLSEFDTPESKRAARENLGLKDYTKDWEVTLRSVKEAVLLTNKALLDLEYFLDKYGKDAEALKAQVAQSLLKIEKINFTLLGTTLTYTNKNGESVSSNLKGDPGNLIFQTVAPLQLEASVPFFYLSDVAALTRTPLVYDYILNESDLYLIVEILLDRYICLFIASFKGTDGYVGLDGKSAYEIAVDEGFKGTKAEWLASLKGAKGEDAEIIGDMIYSPAESIPDSTLSNTHGNLTSRPKSELKGYTFSQLFDLILFKEADGYFWPNTHDNKITPKLEQVEVGNRYNINNFDFTYAIAQYGYPDSTKEWELFLRNTTNNTVTLGDNLFTLQFILNFAKTPVLKTSYGNTSQTVVTNNLKTTKLATIKGYYVIGWSYNASTWNKFNTTTILTNKTINTNSQEAYVYVAIPKDWTLADLKIQDPLDSSKFNSITNFTLESENLRITSLSTLNVYNIWKLGKSAPNSDGSVTPNNKQIQITTIKNS